MDLERELRQAMADHVAQTSAPASLAADVRRRHHRRVIRIRMTISVAATAAIAIAVTPAYHAFTGAPVGAPTTTADTGPRTPGPTTRRPFTSGSPDPRGASATPVPGATAKPTIPAPPHRSGSPDGIRIPVQLTYLPAGLRLSAPCVTERAPDLQTVICRWSGTGGVLEVRVARGSGLGGPEEISSVPPMPQYTSVHGQRAIIAEWADAGSQVTWLERPGVGVSVRVSATLRTRLLSIAEGVRVPS